MTWHPEENVSEWVFFKSQKLLDILDEDVMSATFLRFAPVFIQIDPIYCNPDFINNAPDLFDYDISFF